jgi:hypothetical protein
LLVAVALALGACASSGPPSRGSKFTLFEEEYASWDHFKFSVRMTLQKVVGWQPMASTGDAKVATAQGGWWGAEIPVWPEP